MPSRLSQQLDPKTEKFSSQLELYLLKSETMSRKIFSAAITRTRILFASEDSVCIKRAWSDTSVTHPLNSEQDWLQGLLQSHARALAFRSSRKLKALRMISFGGSASEL